MNWIEILTLMSAVFIANIGVIIPIFLWSRSEAASDRRELYSYMKKAEDEFKEFQRMWARESKEFYSKWAEETKDFHSRLCVIEQQKIKN